MTKTVDYNIGTDFLKKAASLAELKRLWVSKYGNLVKTWVVYLDKTLTGSLSFIDWCANLRSNGYIGKIKKSFDE